MLHVFNVERGNMLTFDMDCACESVAYLRNVIAKAESIPVEKQVLLISGGQCLSSECSVASYGAGTDTNPIFLFNRTLYEDNRLLLQAPNSPELSRPQPKQAGAQGELARLKERVDAACGLDPSLQTLKMRTNLAQELCRLSNFEAKLCRQRVHEQHLQQQAWSAVIANLEDAVAAFDRNAADFAAAYRRFLGRRPQFQAALAAFADDARVLAAVPLLTKLDVAAHRHAIPPQEHQPADSKRQLSGGSLLPPLQSQQQQSPAATPPSPPASPPPPSREPPTTDCLSSLLDYVLSADENGSLDQLAEDCHRGLGQVNTALLQETQDEIQEILIRVGQPQFKNIKGLEDRLSGLEDLMREAEELTSEQDALCQSFLLVLSKATKLRDTDRPQVIPELCSSNAKQLQQLLENYLTLKDINGRCGTAKEELSDNIKYRLGYITLVECQMVELSTKLAVYDKHIRRLTRDLNKVEQIHDAPQIYARSIAEVVRRRRFSSAFLEWAGNLSLRCRDLYVREVEQRHQFNALVRSHFLRALFPGLEDLPPAYGAAQVRPFDDRLPPVDADDLEHLKRVIPAHLVAFLETAPVAPTDAGGNDGGAPLPCSLPHSSSLSILTMMDMEIGCHDGYSSDTSKRVENNHLATSLHSLQSPQEQQRKQQRQQEQATQCGPAEHHQLSQEQSADSSRSIGPGTDSASCDDRLSLEHRTVSDPIIILQVRAPSEVSAAGGAGSLATDGGYATDNSHFAAMDASSEKMPLAFKSVASVSCGRDTIKGLGVSMVEVSSQTDSCCLKSESPELFGEKLKDCVAELRSAVGFMTSDTGELARDISMWTEGFALDALKLADTIATVFRVADSRSEQLESQLEIERHKLRDAQSEIEIYYDQLRQMQELVELSRQELTDKCADYERRIANLVLGHEVELDDLRETSRRQQQRLEEQLAASADELERLRRECDRDHPAEIEALRRDYERRLAAVRDQLDRHHRSELESLRCRYRLTASLISTAAPSHPLGSSPTTAGNVSSSVETGTADAVADDSEANAAHAETNLNVGADSHDLSDRSAEAEIQWKRREEGLLERIATLERQLLHNGAGLFASDACSGIMETDANPSGAITASGGAMSASHYQQQLTMTASTATMADSQYRPSLPMVDSTLTLSSASSGLTTTPLTGFNGGGIAAAASGSSGEAAVEALAELAEEMRAKELDLQQLQLQLLAVASSSGSGSNVVTPGSTIGGSAAFPALAAAAGGVANTPALAVPTVGNGLFFGDRVSILSCSVGDVVLLAYDENHENYVIFMSGPLLHFLHKESVELLQLSTERARATKRWVIGEVVHKDYCEARRAVNRYKLAVGTRFFRVKVRPWDRQAAMRRERERRQLLKAIAAACQLRQKSQQQQQLQNLDSQQQQATSENDVAQQQRSTAILESSQSTDASSSVSSP